MHAHAAGNIASQGAVAHVSCRRPAVAAMLQASTLEQDPRSHMQDMAVAVVTLLLVAPESSIRQRLLHRLPRRT